MSNIVKSAVTFWHPVATVRKYDRDGILYETITAEGNELTTAGLGRIADILTEESGVAALTGSAVRLGIGDDTTAFALGNTDLTTGSDQWYEPLGAGFPQVDGEEITFQAEFGDTDANFAWECWGIDVDDAMSATASDTPADLFNRKVFSFGIKSGGTWTLTVVVTIANS